MQPGVTWNHAEPDVMVQENITHLGVCWTAALWYLYTYTPLLYRTDLSALITLCVIYLIRLGDTHRAYVGLVNIITLTVFHKHNRGAYYSPGIGTMILSFKL